MSEFEAPVVRALRARGLSVELVNGLLLVAPFERLDGATLETLKANKESIIAALVREAEIRLVLTQVRPKLPQPLAELGDGLLWRIVSMACQEAVGITREYADRVIADWKAAAQALQPRDETSAGGEGGAN